MSKKLIIADEETRRRAIAIITSIPLNPVYSVEFKEHKRNRNSEQNSKMWAVLAEISAQVDWYGQHLTGEEWKDVLSAALKRQKVVPGIDGGFVVIGARTSKMSIAEMSEMIEFATAFGTQHGVKWRYYGD